MADTGGRLNSLINISLPAQVPENFTQPEVVQAVRMFIGALTALIQGIEQFTGITQKDTTQWSVLSPNDTLLKANLGRLYIMAGENMNYFHFANIYNDTGVAKARKATSFDVGDAAPRKCHGYCNQAGGAIAGTMTEIIVGQGIMPITGVVAGADLWLSPSSGLAQLTPDTTATHLEQHLGFGVGTDIAYVDIALGTYAQH